MNDTIKKRTLKEIAEQTETAVAEIQTTIAARYKQYNKEKEVESFNLYDERDKMNKRGIAKIDKRVKAKTDPLEEKTKITEMKEAHQNKLRAFDDKITIKMRGIKRAYLRDCNLIITNVCSKFNLNRKHIKRILSNVYNDNL